MVALAAPYICMPRCLTHLPTDEGESSAGRSFVHHTSPASRQVVKLHLPLAVRVADTASHLFTHWPGVKSPRGGHAGITRSLSYVTIVSTIIINSNLVSYLFPMGVFRAEGGVGDTGKHSKTTPKRVANGDTRVRMSRFPYI